MTWWSVNTCEAYVILIISTDGIIHEIRSSSTVARFATGVQSAGQWMIWLRYILI